jgi:sugar O-acyltransferase (sialic acid O-acetyltransferase NeuD family)
VKRIVVVGAGGQARETEWILREINARSPMYEFLGFVVTDLSHLGPHDSRAQVLGDYAWLFENRRSIDALALGIGTPSPRLKVAEDLEREFGPEFWPPLVHPSALYDPSTCRFERGVLVSAGVVGTVNLSFEPFSFANFGCTLGHETVLQRGAVVMPGANISGGVVLEDGVLVGTGAQILQYVRVGKGSTVGAGAVLTKDVPPGETWAGVPARPLRESRPPGPRERDAMAAIGQPKVPSAEPREAA